MIVDIEIVIPGASLAELDLATRQVARQLAAIHGCEVSHRLSQSPDGSKSADGATIGQIVLAVVGSGGVAAGVLSTVGGWLGRNREAKLRIKRGDSEF